MAVVISEETVPLYHFLTNICAIIGGLFTVFSMATGMLDAILLLSFIMLIITLVFLLL